MIPTSIDPDRPRGDAGSSQKVDLNMDRPVEPAIKDKAVLLIRLIQDEVSTTPRSIGKTIITYKINSNIFLEKIKRVVGNIDEITWVKMLKYLRETKKFNYFYKMMLRVPFEHDGGSVMYFPEVYPGNGKMLVQVMIDINDLLPFYPGIPGMETRSWKKGEIIYVPRDKATMCIRAKWLVPIE
jgi:hypothetical protein